MKIKAVFLLFFLSYFITHGQEVTLGTESFTQTYPLSNYYGYQRSAALYTHNEINQSGFINQLAWDLGESGGTRPLKIYFKEIEESTLQASDWSTLVDESTLVFDQAITPLTGLFYLELNQSYFYHSTKSLLVLVEANYGGGGIDDASKLQIKASSIENKHLAAMKDYAPPTDELSFQEHRPNLTLVFGEEITCFKPTALQVEAVSNQSIAVQWSGTSSKYDVYISPTPNRPTSSINLISNVSETIHTFNQLASNTAYYIWVRSHCSTDEYSDWADPLTVHTSLLPASLPYVEDFEGETNFSFVSDTTNKWHIGSAVHHSGTKSLYITNDNGETNAYNGDGIQVSHVFKDFDIPEATTEMALSFDWRCMGEGVNTPYDYFRIWAVPTSYLPQAGETISTSEERYILGAESYNQKDAFTHENITVNAEAFAGQTMRLVFEWIQDRSTDNNPPAAIDNLSLTVITCPAPSNLALEATDTHSIQMQWTPIATTSNYDVAITTTTAYPSDATPFTTIMGHSHTFDNLEVNTRYALWVRSHCTINDKSLWIGPLEVNTPLIPIPLPYTEDFENNPSYGFVNDSNNQWHIGSAVNNGGSHALYISNDGGLTHEYTQEGKQVSHVYKDFTIPQGTVELAIAFDWLNVGEHNYDYFSLWAVPVSYTPIYGTSITTADNRKQIGQAVYDQSEEFTRESLLFNVQGLDMTTLRLVFEWRQDTSSGTNPPAAIDNLSIKPQYCSSVPLENVELTTITHQEVVLNWDSLPNTTRYELFLTTGSTVPTPTTTPTASTSDHTYTFSDLTTDTSYSLWIRTRCNSNNTADWVGPIEFKTRATPQLLPYIQDFESTADLTFQNDTNNKWVIGEAVSYGQGTQSLYISEDGGISNTYNPAGTQCSHAYIDVLIPEEGENLTLSFDWRSNGEDTDYLSVWLIPVSYDPLAGTPLTLANTNGIQLGQEKYFDNSSFRNEQITFDPSPYRGQIMRLVFQWTQDSFSGNQPPAALDNLVLKEDNCSTITTVKVTKEEYSEEFDITWEPAGDESQWEVIILQSNEGFPSYNSTGILVEGEPNYHFSTSVSGTFYSIYVRAICSETAKGFWSQPTDFSIFYPPACANIVVDEIGDYPFIDGKYYLCGDEPTTIELNATYYDIRSTSTYEVESIDYNPPFPFLGGKVIPLSSDDQYTESFDLPFDFCFFGNTYNFCRIGDNGVIAFGLPYTTEFGEASPYNLHGLTIPNEHFSIKNAIYGVFQDMLTSNNPGPNSQINYQVLGSYPCRALVVNFNEVPAYSYPLTNCEGEEYRTTTQIVLYEGTNIIDVYVKNRKPCLLWPREVEGFTQFPGQGLIGIQNEAGTQAHFPGENGGENRNTGAWEATEEAWRFTPAGPSVSSFSWLKDGAFYSNEQHITVDIDQTSTYTGVIHYQHCNGEEMSITKDFHFVKDKIAVPALVNYTICGKANDGGLATVDIQENKAIIFDALGPDAREKYTIAYFKDEALTQPLSDVLTLAAKQVVYIKITHLLSSCYKIASFEVERTAPLVVTQLSPVEVCETYTLQELAEGERYFTQSLGQGKEYKPGEAYTVLGKSTLYIYKEQNQGCYGESAFNLHLYPMAIADEIEDQLLQCELFVLPTLSPNNRYFTAPHATGIELKAGMEISTPMTIYIYAQTGSNLTPCIAESSFVLAFEDCPFPKGFSPNGDGINDTFDLSNYGISKIQIYNRQGVEVYAHGSGYKNQFIGKDKNDNKLPAGTYYYVAISNGKTRTGWVQLNY